MRSEGRIYTSRWDDVDWTDLAYGPQWLYDLLLSQADLEHHGVIALRIPRWAQMARDMTEALVSGFLDELAERRYAVVDPAYGEVLVRSLLREDKVYKQPNVLRSAADRLGQVKSPIIRAALHAELLRIAELPDLTETCALIVKEMLQATQPGAAPLERRARPRTTSKLSGTSSDNPSAKGSGTPVEDRSSEGHRSSADKASAYQSSKPSGDRSSNPAASAAPAAAGSTAKGAGKSSVYDSRDLQPDSARQPTDNPARSAGPSTPVPARADAEQTVTAQAPSDAPAAASAPHPSDEPAARDTPAPARDWAALDTLITRILEPWATQLPAPLSPEHYEEVRFQVADALASGGHTPSRIVAALAAWQAAGGSDPQQLADLIDSWPTGTEGQPPHDPQTDIRGAHQWLAYAPKATP